jgi:2-alkyl-3-oxoalkanoate reductase
VRRPLAAVTGGTGFLGRHIATSLEAHGWRLRLLVRQPPLDPMLARLQPEVVIGDLDNSQALAELVRDADAVIHAAGLIKARTDGDFVRTNGAGSGKIAAAIGQYAPTARFVIISSLAAREPGLSSYAASKRTGEDAAIAACVTAVPIVLRPAATYGPWDRETLWLFQAARLPIFAIPATRSRISLVHVNDVADAVSAVAADRELRGTFEVTDSRWAGYSWREIASAIAAAVESSPRVVGVPAGLLRLARPLLGAGRLGGATMMLSPGKLREILHDDWSSAPASQLPPALWAPRIALEAGLADTVRWYLENGWLKAAARPDERACA